MSPAPVPGRRSIAIVDTSVTPAYPSGKCARELVAALAPDHDVTVFSFAFDDPTGGRARFVRVRAVPWPTALLLPTFWLASGLAYAWRRLRGDRFDVIVTTEGYAPMATVRYAHCCHAVHHQHVGRAPGIRGLAQKATGRIQVVAERRAYRRRPQVVAVSSGLADDLVGAYPHLAGRIVVIPNFVDLAGLEATDDEARRATRAELGVGADDRLLVFVALGHFENKGLPEVYTALTHLTDTPNRLALVVVGGFADRVRQLRLQAEAAGIADRVRFTGMVDDPRPYYWAADAFVLPSLYETFSFVAFEAAAAALPLVATRVHGVTDILVDGVTGWEVTPDTPSVEAALAEVASVDAADLRARGAKARAAVAGFDRARFHQRWSELLSTIVRGVG
jgi:glycosyltransferase involved in cell wall biosynthesis